jgi:hypothetical protein
MRLEPSRSHASQRSRADNRARIPKTAPRPHQGQMEVRRRREAQIDACLWSVAAWQELDLRN